MSDTTRHDHDARALALIDRALKEGRISATSVPQISDPRLAASHADKCGGQTPAPQAAASSVDTPQ
jgi:hypothetical protein